MKRFYIIYFLLTTLLALFHQDLWITNSNTTSRALPVITLFESGTLCIDKYHEKTNDKSFIKEHYYSDKAPLPTLLTIPFFGVAKMCGGVTENDGSLFGPEVYLVGNIFCGSLPFALILFFSMRYAMNRGAGRNRATILTLLAFFGSFIFVFSGTFFAHMLSGLFFLLAFIELEDKKFPLAGFFAGLSFLSEYTIALVFPIWFFQVWWKEKNIVPALKYALGIAPSVLFIMFYNFHFTGSPFEMLYKYHNFEELHSGYGFSIPTWESLWGLSFSLYRGLFIYAPVLIISLLTFCFLLFNGKFKSMFSAIFRDYAIPVSILFFILISCYFGWHGGWTYGPRLLFPIAVLLICRSIPVLLSGWKFIAAIIASCFGLIMSLAVKATHVYSLPTEELNPVFNLVFPSLSRSEWNGNDLFSFVSGSPSGLSIIVFVLMLLTILLIISLIPISKDNSAT